METENRTVMAVVSPESPLRHPERLHPMLWRASQLARPATPVVPTGFASLNPLLPGGGWPLGLMVQCQLPRPGIGELQLLRHALRQLQAPQPVVLVNPPAVPHIQCWANWQLQHLPLLWLQTRTPADALWATEQLLRHNLCNAVLCWVPIVPAAARRKLKLAAQAGSSLFFLFQPGSAQFNRSSAPLHLSLMPAPSGLSLHILKRAGPQVHSPVFLPLYGSHHHSPAGQGATPSAIMALPQPEQLHN